MGKQRHTQKAISTLLPSVNSVDWEGRVRELVQAGILSPLTLDNPGYNHAPIRATRVTYQRPPDRAKNPAGQAERARRDEVQKAKRELESQP